MAEPVLKVRATVHTEVQLTDYRQCSLPADEREELCAFIADLCSDYRLSLLPHLEIEGDVQPHLGLGAGTSTRLAAIEAVFALNGKSVPVEEIRSRSRRGGTSGVGIHTYFEGGLSFDLGHKGNSAQRPSHLWTAPSPPLRLARHPMPSWRFGLCRPRACLPVSRLQERKLFEDILPITQSDISQTLFLSLFGIYAAAAEEDIITFCECIDQLQKMPWKAAEWALHGAPLQEAVVALRKSGARGIALSGMGPTLVFCSEDFDPHELPRELFSYFCLTMPDNHGRRVTVDGSH